MFAGTLQRRASLVAAVLLVAVGPWVPAPLPSAQAAGSPICANVPPQFATATGARIQHLIIDGTPVAVLLPPDYATSSRRYRVLYLLHGGTAGIDSFLANSDLVARTGAIPNSKQFIVVTPYGGLTGFYVDWADGSHDYETQDIGHVIPAIDHLYRTIPTRAGRAIAGVSMGGYGAMHYATSHPDLFGAVGSLSGGLDNQVPDAMAVFLLATQTERQCEDGVPASKVAPFGMFGNPLTDAPRWRAANPVANAGKLIGMDVYLTAGTGLPCDAGDLSSIASDPTASAVETIVGQTTLEMDLALNIARVAHTYLPRPCGIHSERYFTPELDKYIVHLVAVWSG
ncbi:MAG: hypothetical protein JWP74_2519 [Marmoricola sp.]|nr:hypothetical protein [Marmoricola sp.]